MSAPLKNFGAGGILFSGVSVRESVHPKNLVNTISEKNQHREFHPILVTDVFGFIDVLIRFWGQMVKGQGDIGRRHSRRRQPIKFHLVSTHGSANQK